MDSELPIFSAPKQIDLSLDEQKQLKERLKQSNLSTDDQQIFLGMIDFNHWLRFGLQEKKINVSAEVVDKKENL